MRIRKAAPSDAKELWRLNRLFNGPGENTPADMEAFLRASGGEAVFVAEHEESLVGFLCCQVKKSFCYETWTVEITELFVEKGFRRQGLASRLLQAMEDFFSSAPIDCFQLLTGDDNTIAQKFYASMGFVRTRELQMEKEAGG